MADTERVETTRVWLRRLPSSLRLLLLAALVNNFGAGLAAPVTLLFVSRGLGAPIGTATLTVTVTALGAVVVHPVIGWACDRWSGRLGALAGLALSVAGTACFLVATALPMVFVGAFLTGLGQGTTTAWSTLLSDLSPAEERGRVFAANHLTVNVGMGAGLVVAGLVASADDLTAFRALYLGRCLGLGLLAIAVWRIVGRTAARRRQPVRAAPTPDAPRAAPRRLLSFHVGMLWLSVFGLFTFGYAQLDGGYIAGVVATRMLPSSTVAVALSVNTVVVVLANVRFTGHLARLDPARLIRWVPVVWAGSWVTAAAGLSRHSLASALALLTLSSVIFAVGEVVYAMCQPTLTAKLAPEGRTGASFGLQNVATSMGFVCGPAMSAFLLGHVSPPTVMLLLAAAVVTLLAPLVALSRSASANAATEESDAGASSRQVLVPLEVGDAVYVDP